MPEAIKKSDIIEGKILDGFIHELEEVAKAQTVFNNNLKESAKLLKSQITGQKNDSSQAIAESNIRIKEANRLVTEKIALDKAVIQQAKLNEQLLREKIKTQNAVNKEVEKEVKATEKLTRTQKALNSEYSQVQQRLTGLKQRYRDLAIQKELGLKLSVKEEAFLISAESRITKYDTALKKVDAQMGVHGRQVGNYSMAYNGLGNSVNQLTREMPAFANGVQTGLMAISNNLPIFFDEIARIKTANKELIKDGQPVKSMFSQLGASIFSVGTALSIVGTLLTVYGAKMVSWIGSLSKSNIEIQKQIELKKILNKEAKEQGEYVSKETTEYSMLIYQLKQTNAHSSERPELIKKINKEYGTTLKNISDETKFQNQLNLATREWIELKDAEFDIKNREARYELVQKRESKSKQRLPIIAKELKEVDKTINAINKDIRENINILQLENKIDELKILNQKKTNLIDEQVKAQDYLIYAEKRKLVLAGETLELDKKISEIRAGGLVPVEITTGENGKGKTEKIKEIQDLSRAIEDEKIKQINDDAQKRATELIVNANRSIEDLDKLEADGKQKAELEKQIKATLYNDLLNIDKQYIIEQDKIEAEYWAKVKADNKVMEDYQFELADKELEYEAKQAELSLELSKKTGEEKAAIELANEIDLLEQKIILYKAFGKETIDLEIALAKLRNNIVKNEKAETKADADALQKVINDLKQSVNKIVKLGADYYIAQSERKIKQLDKEIAQHEKAQSQMFELAKNGNIQASQSLAVEQQQIVEANKKKEKEARRIARLKLIESGFSAYANNGSVVKTITDLTVLSSALNALAPAFFDGTEDTGTNGNGIDGIGGFHAILHPNERVMTKEQNAKLGGMKNDEVAETISKVRSGETVNIKNGATALNTNWTNIALINEIQDLKNIIKNKPEQNIELGKINQGMMEIIDTKIQGNTSFRNTHIIR